MPKALLDTDIFSEITKAKDRIVIARAHDYLSQEHILTTSAITVMELFKGLHKQNRLEAIQQLQTALQTIEQIAFEPAYARLAGHIYAELERSGQPIGIADVLIASIAIENRLVLVTGNQRHYKRIQSLGFDLQLDNWRIPNS